MNYSIKVVTFCVKPEVRNGLEFEIMLFTMLMMLGIRTVHFGRKGWRKICFCNLQGFLNHKEMNDACENPFVICYFILNEELVLLLYHYHYPLKNIRLDCYFKSFLAKSEFLMFLHIGER
jgi:hypothetical protein